MKTYIRFIIKSILVLIIGFILFAVAGQIYTFARPGYSNIVLDPDPDVGWTLAPNIEFINTGNHWYAQELSVKHSTNSLGFLGPDRPFEKQENTVRIAVLGDSFVEALQVPLAKSAAGVLEQSLNENASDKRYEVFNFGVSNISVGQYLLYWEKFISQFSPDYVFVFLTSMQMKRTDKKLADWGVKIGNPSFELKDGTLIRYPVTGYEEAKAKFTQEIIERGGRSVKRKQQAFIKDWFRQGNHKKLIKAAIPAKLRLSLKQLVTDNTIEPFLPSLKRKITGLIKGSDTASTLMAQAIEGGAPELELEIKESLLDINLKVLEELNRQVSQSGGRLIIADASLYFWFQGANEVLTKRIKSFCDDYDIGYIPVYEDLLETDRNNIWARFEYSHHFNEHGNRIFARSMYQWLKAAPIDLSHP